MGPATPQHEHGTDLDAGGSLVRQPLQLPRLELPPVPSFTRPAAPAETTPATELPIQQQLRDEPPSEWVSPFPAPEPDAYTYRVMPPPLPVSQPVEHAFPRPSFRNGMSPAVAPLTTPAPMPAPVPVAMPAPVSVAMPAPVPVAMPAPVQSAVPLMQTYAAPGATTQVGDEELPTTVSRVAITSMLVTAVFLYWASGMAFSAALLGLAGLLVSDVAIALSLTRASGAKRPTSSTIAAAGALVLALLTVLGAFGAFSEMAMVAGLFVIAAGIPTLLLLGVTSLVLRRRSPRSLADESLRSGAAIRFGVTVAIVLAGVLVRDSFSATPDAILAFVIAALVATNAVHVLRGTGRAATRA